MKYSHLKGLEKHLAEAAPDHLSPLYLVIAADPYDRESGIGRIKAALALPVTKIVKEGATPASIGDELNANSLFVQKRAVFLPEIDLFPKPIHDFLKTYCANPNPLVTLLLSASALRSNSTLLRAIEQAGVVLSISGKGGERELSTWLLETAKERGISLEPAAAQWLVKHTTLKGALASELDKLVCYKGEGQPITLQDVQKLGAGASNESAWDVGRAIMEGKGERALSLVRTLLQGETEPLSLLGQIRHQLQTGMHVASILARGGSPHEVTSAFPYMKGWVLDQNVTLARTYGLHNFRRALITVQETDLRAKNSSAAPNLLLELLVAKATL